MRLTEEREDDGPHECADCVMLGNEVDRLNGLLEVAHVHDPRVCGECAHLVRDETVRRVEAEQALARERFDRRVAK